MDKSRIQADIGAVRKRNGEEFEGIRQKHDFERNAVFKQNEWEFCTFELKEGEVPIGLYGVITGK